MAVAVANDALSADDRALVDALMAATGATAWIGDEALMDAVTAVSGSGPAYVFYLAECLAAAGRAAGLDDALAEQLARQTVVGGGALLDAASKPAAILRENVTSPGGTTEAALAVLMAEDGLKALLKKAVAAAKARSIELG
jgi:pyrroline-5-carboxylate reductase